MTSEHNATVSSENNSQSNNNSIGGSHISTLIRPAAILSESHSQQKISRGLIFIYLIEENSPEVTPRCFFFSISL